jgi:DNA-binding transcriptional LysR family regulator
MTLEQLRIFVAVAECEHLTRAAADLRLAPSAVSAAIRELERRHGVVLFDRIRRRIRLTEIGRAFLAEARAVVERSARAERRLAELAGRIDGTIRIEASLTIAAYWLPARLVAFRRTHPGVTVDVAVANTSHVARAVAEGEADVGFVEGECDGASLLVRTVDRDRLVLVGDASMTAAAAPSTDDLRGWDWILREKGSGTRSEFEAELRRRGVEPAALRVPFELPSNEAVMAAIVAGGGVGVLSESVVRGALDAGRLVALDACFAERPFQILRHAARSPSRAVAAFVAGL